MQIAIPLFGKMIFRAFHTRHFVETFRQNELEPLYCTNETAASHALPGARYSPFPMPDAKGPERILINFRRLVAHPEVSDMRFRDQLYGTLFHQKSIVKWFIAGVGLDILRRQAWLAPWSLLLSRRLANREAYARLLDTHAVDGLMTSGIGSAGFDTVNPMVYEAQRRGLPVVAAVSNYDNVLSRGYRGFMPALFAVWSRVMADDAMRLLGVPARRIEICGPVSFDRYFQPLRVDRRAYLTSRALDPDRPTILYAGGPNLLTGLHVLRLFLTKFRPAFGECNIVMRLHPDPRLAALPTGWCMEQIGREFHHVYISDPLRFSADTINAADDTDELHGLLKYSDVIIQHYSTLALEAAVCDLPTVYMKYDPCHYFHYWSTTSEWQSRQIHNQRALRRAAGREATSDDDLLKVATEYLENRQRDRDARREYALSECSYMDGRSCERLAAAISRTCRKGVR